MESTTLPRTWDGSCDPPKNKSKAIHVRRGLKDERHMEVCLHEMLHACDYTKDEEAIEEMARDIARAMWRLGYRRVGDAG
jgi:hypothetical protein